MKKYIGAVVRKSFQLPIAAEQDHFENKIPCTKKTYLFLPTGTLKKSKTIFTLMTLPVKIIRGKSVWCGCTIISTHRDHFEERSWAVSSHSRTTHGAYDTTNLFALTHFEEFAVAYCGLALLLFASEYLFDAGLVSGWQRFRMTENAVGLGISVLYNTVHLLQISYLSIFF